MNNLLFILTSIIFFHIIKQSQTSKIKIISIPFKREIPKEINEKNIFEYLNNNIMQRIIDISNKHFKIPLNIKLRQYPFFFTSPENYPQLKTFNYNQSSTFMKNKKLMHFNSYDFIKGFKGNDTIIINNNKIFQFNFFIGNILRENIYENGIIGLNIEDPEIKFSDINFIYQLKERKYINSYEFTIKFNDNENGELIFGGKPHEYDNNNYIINNYKIIKPYLKTYGNHYDIEINCIYFGNLNVTNKDKIIGELSIENGFIIGNELYKNKVKELFFNKFINESKCFENKIEGKIIFYYTCNNNVNISQLESIKFYIESIDFNFELTYKDLFYEFNNTFYFLVIFKGAKKNPNWVLGKPLLKKYQFVFDQRNKIIGFYSNFTKSNKKLSYDFNIFSNEFIIGIFFFSLILILLIKIFIYNKNKKPIKEDIIDGMEFTKHIDNENKSSLGIL